MPKLTNPAPTPAALASAESYLRSAFLESGTPKLILIPRFQNQQQIISIYSSPSLHDISYEVGIVLGRPLRRAQGRAGLAFELDVLEEIVHPLQAALKLSEPFDIRVL